MKHLKSLIFSLAIFASFASFACTDFSGKYLDTNMNEIFEVSQKNCQSITVKSENPAWDFSSPLDGKLRLAQQSPELTISVAAQMLNEVLFVSYNFSALFDSKNGGVIEFKCTKLSTGDLNVNMTIQSKQCEQSGDILFKKL